MSRMPVTCTLGSRELRAQAARWRRLYAEAGIERTATDDGLRVRFRPAAERELRELVAVEAECCAWARWSVDARGEEVVLEIDAAGDRVAVIHGWLLAEEAVRS